MWPKLLFDLLPHFARLMPMADKYLSSRSTSEKAQEAALAALAGDVRGELGKVTGELGKVTEANSGVSRQLQEQGTQIADLGVDVARARMGVESVEARIAKLEKTASSSRALLGGAIGMLAFACALLIDLVIRSRR